MIVLSVILLALCVRHALTSDVSVDDLFDKAKDTQDKVAQLHQHMKFAVDLAQTLQRMMIGRVKIPDILKKVEEIQKGKQIASRLYRELRINDQDYYNALELFDDTETKLLTDPDSSMTSRLRKGLTSTASSIGSAFKTYAPRALGYTASTLGSGVQRYAPGILSSTASTLGGAVKTYGPGVLGYTASALGSGLQKLKGLYDYSPYSSSSSSSSEPALSVLPLSPVQEDRRTRPHCRRIERTGQPSCQQVDEFGQNDEDCQVIKNGCRIKSSAKSNVANR